jgi:hypothetical protein
LTTMFVYHVPRCYVHFITFGEFSHSSVQVTFTAVKFWFEESVKKIASIVGRESLNRFDVVSDVVADVYGIAS